MKLAKFKLWKQSNFRKGILPLRIIFIIRYIVTVTTLVSEILIFMFFFEIIGIIERKIKLDIKQGGSISQKMRKKNLTWYIFTPTNTGVWLNTSSKMNKKKQQQKNNKKQVK